MEIDNKEKLIDFLGDIANDLIYFDLECGAKNDELNHDEHIALLVYHTSPTMARSRRLERINKLTKFIYELNKEQQNDCR